MHNESPDKTEPRRVLRFSLGSLMLLTAVVGLSIALVMVYAKLQKAERELNALQPMTAEEVARKFEQATDFGQFTTRVTDVRYSQSENVFKVNFTWTDPTTKTAWSTDVKLESDGFGAYFGKIYSGEFLKSVGSKNEYYVVAVETPSPLKQK